MTRTVVVAASLALLSLACTSESVTVQPPVSSPTPLVEVTVDGCVVERGTTEPTPATGEDFTTIVEGLLTVGTLAPNPPFADLRDGEPIGFEIELTTEVSKRIGGLEVEVVPGTRDSLFPDLAAGRFDVVIGSLTIEDDNRQAVDLTDAYFTADQALSIRTTDAGTINGVEDLQGRVVGVRAGTAAEDCARNVLRERYGVSEVLAYDSVEEAFDDLGTGTSDAVLTDLPTSRLMAEDRVGFALAQVIVTREEYAIAVSRREPNLREAINASLDDIRADGTYRRLFEEWFRSEPPGE